MHFMTPPMRKHFLNYKLEG
uniref:Uncharacterized protein n=1 Tax=Rhizophora mucronata TaxID=61149 RepID=A0A2P2QXR1_RHIMU